MGEAYEADGIESQGPVRKRKHTGRQAEKKAEKDAEREKKRAKMQEEKELAAKAQAARIKNAAAYLKTWKEDRANWKFNKKTQVWIIKSMLDRKLISKVAFSGYLIDYLGSIQGGVVERIRIDAKKAVDSVEQGGMTLKDRVARIEKKKNKTVKEPKADDEVPVEMTEAKAAAPSEVDDTQEKIKSLRSKYKRAKQILALLGEPSVVEEANEKSQDDTKEKTD
uniref:WKF domain-containing protein n=1 Tax=Mucochytrium quahogii TaxID=96639 RepID=A0A7S2RDV3_9STRA|mmetsp:Transcript_22578/g.35962  ORF Transcript_22578/g.35962 Transcript_22578/m.35962 type:complete len:223 (+) Transcript_22578:114-782(+)|eukprot:CAMPEP_0203749990 /NCGR_PEP_ID=MMETSP0098-20131031/4316_1 /ASSEMBLY_ACC=CAM_ASM_000208 /TAXON_ID=96639 /ORGANISM=" , Strain NY0313808BC1" /LENGTH=222 /DNA_ID=CAMNT_0050639113 /DNA_START=114 /DNA_END=782 /DNA_ORIENTATION=+